MTASIAIGILMSIAAADDRPQMIIYTQDYCEPCQRWKRDELPKLNDRVEIEYRKPVPGVRVVPTFVLVNRYTGEAVHTMVGYRTSEQITRVISDRLY